MRFRDPAYQNRLRERARERDNESTHAPFTGNMCGFCGQQKREGLYGKWCPCPLSQKEKRNGKN